MRCRYRGWLVSLVGYPAENHPQQVGVRGALDKVDDRRTISMASRAMGGSVASHDPAATPGLRELAEHARDEQAEWWLWDEPREARVGSMLSFAHAATPEAIIDLLDDIESWKKVAREYEAALADRGLL